MCSFNWLLISYFTIYPSITFFFERVNDLFPFNIYICCCLQSTQLDKSNSKCVMFQTRWLFLFIVLSPWRQQLTWTLGDEKTNFSNNLLPKFRHFVLIKKQFSDSTCLRQILKEFRLFSPYIWMNFAETYFLVMIVAFRIFRLFLHSLHELCLASVLARVAKNEWDVGLAFRISAQSWWEARARSRWRKSTG